MYQLILFIKGKKFKVLHCFNWTLCMISAQLVLASDWPALFPSSVVGEKKKRSRLTTKTATLKRTKKKARGSHLVLGDVTGRRLSLKNGSNCRRSNWGQAWFVRCVLPAWKDKRCAPPWVKPGLPHPIMTSRGSWKRQPALLVMTREWTWSVGGELDVPALKPSIAHSWSR